MENKKSIEHRHSNDRSDMKVACWFSPQLSKFDDKKDNALGQNQSILMSYDLHINLPPELPPPLKKCGVSTMALYQSVCRIHVKPLAFLLVLYVLLTRMVSVYLFNRKLCCVAMSCPLYKHIRYTYILTPGNYTKPDNDIYQSASHHYRILWII